eukprot:1711162-Alexandrium_andersonii.AAC.1
MFKCSINAGATRFDRFYSPLGSIGTRCSCHRVAPLISRVAARSPRRPPAVGRWGRSLGLKP